MQREFVAAQEGWVKSALLDRDKRQHWSKWRTEFPRHSNLIGRFSFLPQASECVQLPLLSFLLRVPFTLRKPYLSRDDRTFHVLDNPVKKEWVFQVPFVAAPSWKGALRAALWQLGYEETNDVTIRLLGNPRESEEGQAGRLYFYPTFFNEIGLEVINPHDRVTGVGDRGPILMECVPTGETGELVVLYVPFDPTKQSEADRCAQVAQDLEVLTKGVHDMLTTYGFGAKTSDGYGSVEDRLAGTGTLAIRAELPGLASATGAASELKRPLPNLPRYLEMSARLHADLRRPDGSLRSEAEYEALIKSRGGQYGKKQRQLYDKSKKRWEREGRQLAESAGQAQEPESAPTPPPKPPVTEEAFGTLADLVRKAAQLAAQLRESTPHG